MIHSKTACSFKSEINPMFNFVPITLFFFTNFQLVNVSLQLFQLVNVAVFILLWGSIGGDLTERFN